MPPPHSGAPGYTPPFFPFTLRGGERRAGRAPPLQGGRNDRWAAEPIGAERSHSNCQRGESEALEGGARAVRLRGLSPRLADEAEAVRRRERGERLCTVRVSVRVYIYTACVCILIYYIHTHCVCHWIQCGGFISYNIYIIPSSYSIYNPCAVICTDLHTNTLYTYIISHY